MSPGVDLNNYKHLSTTITEMGNTRDVAMLASLGLPHAGAWLIVIPSPTLCLHLSSSEFVVSVKYRLGVDVFPAAAQCMACPHQSDPAGDHAISCGWGGERIFRHNAIRDALFNTCTQACLTPSREDRALLPGTDARPADLYIPAWTGGKDTALDITVVNPLQVAMVQQAAVTPGHALVKAYDRKMAKHGEACGRAGIVFKPIPFETLGGWGAESVVQVKMMGSALALAWHLRGEESEVIRHLVQRVSILLVKVNANLLLNRAPNNSPPHIDGYE